MSLRDWEGLRGPVEDGEGDSSLCVCAGGTRDPWVDSGVSTTSCICVELSRFPIGPCASGVDVEICVSAWVGMNGVRLTWGIVFPFSPLWTVGNDLRIVVMVEGFESPLALTGKF